VRPSSLLQRANERNPLPEGTLAVGGGLLVAGVTSYGFLVISARMLGAHRYSGLSVLWALVFLVGPGFFLPLEQEVGRALAARRVLGQGGRPVVMKAAAAGGALAVIVSLASLLGARAILDHLLDDQVLLFVGLLLAFIGYLFEHLTRGALSGNGRFGPYGVVIGAEGAARMAGCVLLAVVGVETAGPYGLVLGLAPFVAVGLGLRGQRDLAQPGPDAPWAELSTALGYLLTASLLAQLLVNAGPLAVKVLAADSEQDAAGRFLAGLVLARIPLFLFQAVQASLIPKLATLAAAGKLREFREGMRKLLGLVLALGVAATIVCVTIGPDLVELVFGGEFRLGRADLGYLAAASAAYIVALSLAQALISLAGYARVTIAWLVGIAAFVAVVASIDELLLRVEVGFLVGSLVAAVAMGVLLLTMLGQPGLHVADPTAVDATPDVTIEP
jgi:O-antigen/teichoic acid export membrane protein